MRWPARQDAGILLHVGQDYHFSSVNPAVRLLLLLKSFPHVSLAIDLKPPPSLSPDVAPKKETTERKIEIFSLPHTRKRAQSHLPVNLQRDKDQIPQGMCRVLAVGVLYAVYIRHPRAGSFESERYS